MKKLIYFYCSPKLRGFDETEFNFFSKYKIHFDKDTKTLTVTKNTENYIDNFYDDNIEINAIVGNNGTGKSTLLKRIFRICHSEIKNIEAEEIILGFELTEFSHPFFIYFDIEKRDCKWTEIIYKDNKLCVQRRLEDFDKDVLNEEDHKKQFNVHHCQYITEVLDFEMYDNTKYPTMGMMRSDLSEYPYDNTKMMSFFSYQLKQQSFFLSNSAEKIKLPFTYPENLKIFSSYVPYKVCMTLKNSEDGEDTYGSPMDEDLVNIILNLRNLSNEQNFIALYHLPNEFEDSILELLLMLFLKSVSEEEKKEISNYTYSDEFKCISGIYKKVNNIFDFMERKNSVNIAPYREFLKFLYHPEKKIVINEEKRCLEVPLGSIEGFLNTYPHIAGEKQFLHFSWGLSSGETAMLDLYSKFYQIYQSIKGSEKKDVLLLIDEADAYFHPQWQKNYVRDTLDVAKQIFEGFGVQIILATHSPIMLSDIPKQNVLYLKKEENAGTKVVPREERLETFGANIFSLFKDTFFLEGSGIGSFAEENLEELLKRIHDLKEINEEEIEYIKKRIMMIGDPFIRQKFENEFYICIEKDSQRSLDEKIRFFEKEIESLKKQKERDKNDKD